MLEHADLVGSWGFSYVSWNEAAIEPVGESKSNAEVTRLLAARLGLDDDVFAHDDHQLMELALTDAPAGASGVTAEALRAEGVMRVGPPAGTAVAAEMTFAFDDERLSTAGLDPVVEYRPPAATPDGGAVPAPTPDAEAALLDQLVVRAAPGDDQRRT